MPADDCLRLEAAPLPLPWRGEDPTLDIHFHFAERAWGKSGTDGTRIRAYADNDGDGYVDITGPLCSRVASAYRPVKGETLEGTRRECERHAGLLLAALGLPRPGEEGDSDG